MTGYKAKTTGREKVGSQMFRGFGNSGITLVEKGPGLGPQRQEPLDGKAADGPKKRFDYQKQYRLNTELLSASKNGGLAEVKRALDEGADVNATNIVGGTPLMAAAAGKHTEVVRLLLERGADAKLTDNEGRTALTLAAAHRHSDIVELLRNFKAI